MIFKPVIKLALSVRYYVFPIGDQGTTEGNYTSMNIGQLIHDIELPIYLDLGVNITQPYALNDAITHRPIILDMKKYR